MTSGIKRRHNAPTNRTNVLLDSEETHRVWTLPNSGTIHVSCAPGARGGAPLQWALKLKAELGMPSDALWRRLTIEGPALDAAMASLGTRRKHKHSDSPERWRHYRLELFGMVVPEPPLGRDYPWPYWRNSDRTGATADELVQLWRQRAKHSDSPVCCEVSWHPENGRKIALKGLEKANKQSDLLLAWDGLKLLQKSVPQGRPSGTTTLTKEEFWEQAPLACLKWRDTFGCWPTDIELAQGLFISRATLYNYMRRHGFTMEQIRRQAVQPT